jgi:hypothetical protein
LAPSTTQNGAWIGFPFRILFRDGPSSEGTLRIHQPLLREDQMKMNLGSLFVGCLAILASHSACEATGTTFTGTINSVWAQDNTMGANTDFIRVSSATSLAGCQVDEGFLNLRVKDDIRGTRSLSIALTAFSTGSTVTVYVDNANKASDGTCYLGWIKLVAP